MADANTADDGRNPHVVTTLDQLEALYDKPFRAVAG
jgi:hypothetical protein